MTNRDRNAAPLSGVSSTRGSAGTVPTHTPAIALAARMDPRVHALFREVRIESGLPQGSAVGGS